MKKIFTLAVATTLFVSAFAQYKNGGQRNDHSKKDHDVVYNYNKGYNKNDRRFNDSYYFSVRERDMQIAQINRSFDFRIREVKNKLFMNRFKKVQTINFLEDQRRDEIRRVYFKFSDRRNSFNDFDKRRH